MIRIYLRAFLFWLRRVPGRLVGFHEEVIAYDIIHRIAHDHRRLWMSGRNATEVWVSLRTKRMIAYNEIETACGILRVRIDRSMPDGAWRLA